MVDIQINQIQKEEIEVVAMSEVESKAGEFLNDK
jgi:hypothetical protein